MIGIFWRLFAKRKSQQRQTKTFVLSLFALLLFSFQNCTPSNLSSVVSDVTNLKLGGGGNGEPYDGKPTYDRFVPGLTCDDHSLAVGSLDIHGSTATLITNEQSCQRQSSEVPVSSLELSSFSSRYIGYGGGVYTFTQDRNDSVKKGLFTETWCRAMKQDRSGSLFEFAVEWQEQGSVASLYTMSEATPQASAVSATRQLDVDQVSYRTNDGVLQIRFKQMIPGMQKVAGVYSGKLDDQETKPLSVECLMGGQFDPVAPQFDYASGTQRTLEVGETISDLTPIVNKSTVQFSLEGNLPEGLQFQASTGAITGTARVPTARQQIQVSALFAFGRVTRPVSIGVGAVVKIDRLTSTEVCSLSAVGCDLWGAVELANQMAPLPLIAYLSVPSIGWDGVEMGLQGDLSLVGANADLTVLDAKSLSSHFDVHSKGHLEIQHLKLINGKGDRGGSIYVDQGSLVVRNSRFENNMVSGNVDGGATAGGNSTVGWGGAIYASNSRVEILNSTFIGNQAPVNGSRLGGGAIAIEGGVMTRIRDSVFKSNKAQMGGAIFVMNAENGSRPAQSDIVNCVFDSNWALQGGAIQNEGSDLAISGSQFLNNQTSFQGSAIFYSLSDRAWLMNSVFDGNKGIGIDAGPVYWQGLYWGGAAYRGQVSTLYVLESQFQNNSCSSPGAGVLQAVTGNAILRGTTFQNNGTLQSCKANPDLIVSQILSLGGNQVSDNSCP